MARCPKCDVSVPSVNCLKLHLKIKHLGESTSLYSCKEDNCARDFPNWAGFRSHLISAHRISIKLKAQNGGIPNNKKMTHISHEEFLSNDAENELLSDPIGTEFCSEKVSSHFQNIFLNFVGKLYAAPNLPRSLVQVVFDGTKVLLREIFDIMTDVIQKCDNGNSGSFSHLQRIIESIMNPLNLFSSEFKRLKLLSETGCYIEPKSYPVGSSVQEKLVDGRIVKQMTNNTGQYVPISQILQRFFSLPGVLDTVLNYMNILEKQEGVLSNFVQGYLWRSKKQQYYENKTVIPLFFYHDDFECNDPLGSRAGIQKLGGTYFSIPCLPPEYQSTLDNIFLALLTHSADRHDPYVSICKNDEIFGILINQINHLQEHGILVENGETKTLVYFALGLFWGDNEGLNSTQDYVESFNGTHCCRTCYAHQEVLRSSLKENPELLRSEDEYLSDVQKGYRETGIKKYSIWNTVKMGHHVYKNYTWDLLHDDEEGLKKYGMFHIVNHIVNHAKKRVSLEVLNDRIKTFNYSANGKVNRPPLISVRDLNVKQSLKMSGSEMRNFVLIFAMLVGDLIDHDEVWDYYLIIRSISDIIYAKSLQIECTYLLDHLVAEHHRLYIKLFNEWLKPKHHNFIHCGRIMRMSGPVTHLNSIRFEGNHRRHKIRANATCSRRNITHTIAVKEQLELCYRFVGGCGLDLKFDTGPTLIPEDRESLPVHLRDDFLETSWVDYKGTKYKRGYCVLLKVDEIHSLPVFGVIQKIYCSDNANISLLCEHLYTYGKNQKFHAYQVEKLSAPPTSYVMINQLLRPDTVILVNKGDSGMFATVRSAL